MSGLRRLRDSRQRAEGDAGARHSAREDRVRLRHRLLQPLPVLHEHLRLSHHPRPRAGGRHRAQVRAIPICRSGWSPATATASRSAATTSCTRSAATSTSRSCCSTTASTASPKASTRPPRELGKKTKSHADGLDRLPAQPAVARASAAKRRSSRARSTPTSSTSASRSKRAAEHKGTAFVEIYQNCNVFNDGAFEYFTDKAMKSETAARCSSTASRMLFGKEQEKGIRLNRARSSPRW